MADNTYYLEALLAANNFHPVDDGTGIDTIVVSDIHTISQASIDLGNYAVRVFLTSAGGVEGQAFGEIMHTDPLLYETVYFQGIYENILGAGGRESYGGNAHANFILGDPIDLAGAHDAIFGWGGHDTLMGAGGSDLIDGGGGNDRLFGDTDPGAQDTGNVAAGDDTMSGGDGDDLFIGGPGTNTLDGGTGFDHVSYADYYDNGSVSFRVEVNLIAGQSTLFVIDSYDGSQYPYAVDLVSNIEHFTGTAEADVMLGGPDFVLGDQTRITFDGLGGNDTLTGGDGADVINGGDGNDVLDAGLNLNIDYIADLLAGGAGNDTYHLHDAADIVETWNAGNDSVVSDIALTLGYNLENLMLTNLAGAAQAVGNVLDNRIVGNAFANFLDGRGGLNTLEGGAGNDVYVVHLNEYLNVLDNVVEEAGAGIDTVQTNSSFGLSSFANVENLVLLGTGDFYGVGNSLANHITGNSGKNELYVGDNDTVAGGDGDDTYHIIGTTRPIVVELADGGTDTARIYNTYTLAAEIERLVVQTTGGASGFGNLGNNILTGNTGHDLLNGRGGNDSLIGGQGNDSLAGDTGNDTLRGDLGNDSLVGGDGIDLASYIGATAIHIDLTLTTAQDTGLGLDSFRQIENLLGGNAGDVLQGNGVDNSLSGGLGQDDLAGRGGNDSLVGGEGDDSLRGDGGNDVMNGGANNDTVVFTGTAAATVTLAQSTAQNTGYGIDTLISIENLTTGAGNDTLTGSGLGNFLNGMAGNDSINGGAGGDWIWGGTGNDRLNGGADGDVFVFGSADGTDTITGFQNGIDALVMGIFASVTVQDAGLDTLLIFGSTRVTLVNVDHTLIDAADFLVP